LTFEFKVRKPSTLKRSRIIRTASFVTNLKSQLLEQYKEDYRNPRADGAIALVLSVNGSETKRSTLLGEKLYSEFARSLPENRRFSPRVSTGACRNAATMMINWVQRIAKLFHQPTPSAEGGGRRRQASDVLKGLTLERFYEGWRQVAERYEQAAATIIPFGRHKGIPLAEVGRREARWLISRMLSREELELTLKYVNQLLEKSPSLADDAIFASHPYKRNGRRKLSLEASRLIQRVIEPFDSAEPVLLGLLDSRELKTLRDELKEQIEAGAVRDQTPLLSDLQEVLTETVAASEGLDTLEEAFLIFLHEKPPQFPSIALVDPELGTQDQAIAGFRTSLNWFRPNLDRQGDIEKYRNEALEAAAREQLERAAGRLRRMTPQPIPFIGTIKPKKGTNFRDCALLFDEETFEYVFVAKLRGDEDQLSQEEIEQRKAQAESSERENRLRYANFPLHRFQMPPRAALEIYPLEWGEASARNRFLTKRAPLLKQLIENQRKFQTELFEAGLLEGMDEEDAREASLTVAPVFTTARLILRPDRHDKLEAFVQITITFPEPERPEPELRVIGIHEHQEGYSYAVVGLDGQPLCKPNGEELVGDVLIPAHAEPATGAPRSDNSAFEMANAIVSQAGASIIGIEDTSYRKSRTELSRERNRAIFQRPSKKIVAVTNYKARLKGLPAPVLVSNISPSRDCAACGVRLSKGASGIRVEKRATCPECDSLQTVSGMSQTIECSTCRFVWRPRRQEMVKEYYFACPSCSGGRKSARHNTAIAVAQETLRHLRERGAANADTEIEAG